MKINILTVFIFVFFLSAYAAESGNSDLENLSTSRLLEELDKVVGNRYVYMSERQTRADSLRHSLDAAEISRDKIRIMFDLADLQRHISADSTIATLDRGFGLARAERDSISAERIVILRAREYFNMGHVHEAFLDLNYAERDGIHPHNWLIYHDVCRSIYMTLGLFNEYRPFSGDMVETGIIHASKEKALLSSDDPLYSLCDAHIYLAREDLPAMKKALDDCLSQLTQYHELYGDAHALLGSYYIMTADRDSAIRHLAIAAIHDTKSSDLDGIALLYLGEILSSEGEYSRGHSYLLAAMDNALRSHIKYNLMRVSEAFVDSASLIEKERNTRFRILIIAFVLLLCLCLIIFKLVTDKRKELHRLRQTDKSLASSNLTKDTFISEFMNLCSEYLGSLEEYNNMCRRMIFAGKNEELLEIINSETILDEQRKKFFDIFDRAFVQLYPDFVSDINSLLQEDRQIVTTDNSLTTELRILAMSWLGIEDSTKVANFLGITTNTIYNYRNKMRTRAKDRNTFDEDLRRLRRV